MIDPWSVAAFMPAVVMSLCCLAASLFYAGSPWRGMKYLPKFIDRPLPEYRHVLFLAAAASFLLALILCARFLPWVGLLIMLMQGMAVMAYTLVCGKTRYWFYQSTIVAYICMNCVVMGSLDASFAQGSVIGQLMLFTFSTYLLREVLKRLDEASRNPDLADMPLKVSIEDPPVYIGIGGGMRVAGIVALFTITFFTLVFPHEGSPLLNTGYLCLLLGLCLLFTWLISGLRTFFIRGTHHAVTALVWVLMVVLVTNRPV
jgi:hypothetical protein